MSTSLETLGFASTYKCTSHVTLTTDMFFGDEDNPTMWFVLRLTRVEANVDLKDQRAKVLEGRLQENKDVGGFHDNSWQQSVA